MRWLSELLRNKQFNGYRKWRNIVIITKWQFARKVRRSGKYNILLFQVFFMRLCHSICPNQFMNTSDRIRSQVKCKCVYWVLWVWHRVCLAVCTHYFLLCCVRNFWSLQNAFFLNLKNEFHVKFMNLGLCQIVGTHKSCQMTILKKNIRTAKSPKICNVKLMRWNTENSLVWYMPSWRSTDIMWFVPMLCTYHKKEGSYKFQLKRPVLGFSFEL